MLHLTPQENTFLRACLRDGRAMRPGFNLRRAMRAAGLECRRACDEPASVPPPSPSFRQRRRERASDWEIYVKQPDGSVACAVESFKKREARERAIAREDSEVGAPPFPQGLEEGAQHQE